MKRSRASCLCDGILLKSSGQPSKLPRRFKLTAHPCWRNRWRSQLIGAGHLDTTWFRVRMVGRQRTTPGKSIRFGGLPLTKVDTGRGLTAPIVDRVIELDSAT